MMLTAGVNGAIALVSKYWLKVQTLKLGIMEWR